MSSWLQMLLPRIKKGDAASHKSIPEGVWAKCGECDAVLYRAELEANALVCPKCGHHERMSARERLKHLLDEEGREEIGASVLPTDPLKFKDSRKYLERLNSAATETGEAEALIVMRGSIEGQPVVVACFEFGFLGGSMGSVVGERFVRGVLAAREAGVPFICFSASGGARMQEGLLSLMQMAKTTAALTQLVQDRLPFISVLTDPTMGGVSASFAFMGDIVIAEPGALIGFAGSRVIEQTVRETLPEGFQRAEFLLEKGAIDMIVDRREMRSKLALLLSLLTAQQAVATEAVVVREEVADGDAQASDGERPDPDAELA